MSERWLLCEQGNYEEGFTWDLMLKEGGKLKLVASFFDEKWSESAVAAMNWYESLEDSRLSLAMEGISFDPKTGKARTRRTSRLSVKFEPPLKRTRKPRG